MVQKSKEYLTWYEKLQQLAMESHLQWLISSTPAQHLGAYNKGFSPDEELAELEELATWKGCGCGA